MSRGLRAGALLTVFCRPVPGAIGFLFANVRAAFGVAIPPLSLEMLDARRQVQPNNDIGRAMLLGLLLSRK